MLASGECETAYLRVYGNLRTLSGQRVVIAFRLIYVEDFNEFTHHMLSVMHASVLQVTTCCAHRVKPVLAGNFHVQWLARSGRARCLLEFIRLHLGPPPRHLRGGQRGKKVVAATTG